MGVLVGDPVVGTILGPVGWIVGSEVEVGWVVKVGLGVGTTDGFIVGVVDKGVNVGLENGTLDWGDEGRKLRGNVGDEDEGKKLRPVGVDVGAEDFDGKIDGLIEGVMLVAIDGDKLGLTVATTEDDTDGVADNSIEGDALGCVCTSVGKDDGATVEGKLTGTLLGW